MLARVSPLFVVLLLAACSSGPPQAAGTPAPEVLVVRTAARMNPAMEIATHRAAVRATWTAVARTPLAPGLAPTEQTATIAARAASVRITEIMWSMLASDTPGPAATRTPTPTPMPPPPPRAASIPTPLPGTQPLLRINNGPYVDTLDPQRAHFSWEISHLRLIYEGLTRLDADLNTVPAAAERWTYNADATVITFTLREGLMYSDGTLLNARRFEYALRRNVDPHVNGEYAAITDDIAGALQWRSASPDDTSAEEQARLAAAVEIQALDAAGRPCTRYEQPDCRTLRIGLARPAAYFHTIMSMWIAYPAKEENITAGGDRWWSGSPYQTGNGPFVLDHLEPFVRAYFSPNPRYWRGQPRYDIEFRYVEDPAIVLQQYMEDQVDIARDDTGELLERWMWLQEGSGELTAQVSITPATCTFALMYHQLKPPFDDPQVRAAFTLALERELYVRDVLDGWGLPTLTWIPPGYPGHTARETRWDFDPEAARRALAASSYGSADRLPEIRVTFNDTPQGRRRMNWLAQQWQSVLGVQVLLDPRQNYYGPFIAAIDFAPQLGLLGWCADYPDPHDWFSKYWRTGGIANSAFGYSNPVLDALLDEAAGTVDAAERLALYRRAQDLLVDGVPAAFMYNSTNQCLIKPWVRGVVPTPLDSDWCGSNDPLAISVQGH